MGRMNEGRHKWAGSLTTTKIAGVKTGNHSNPNVMKIAEGTENRNSYAAGGRCGLAEGGSSRPRLDRPGRKMKKAEGGGVRDAVARGVNTVPVVEGIAKGYRGEAERQKFNKNMMDAANKIKSNPPDNEDSSIATERKNGGRTKGFLSNLKKGALHKEMGVKAGEKIPAKKLEKAAHSDNPLLKKRAVFAENARHWKKK